MAHVTINSFDSRWTIGRLLRFLEAIGTILRDRLRRRRVRHAIAAELEQYSQEEIAELGISRADIDFVAERAARR